MVYGSRNACELKTGQDLDIPRPMPEKKACEGNQSVGTPFSSFLTPLSNHPFGGRTADLGDIPHPTSKGADTWLPRVGERITLQMPAERIQWRVSRPWIYASTS